jgi:hypothetical protein
VEIHKVGVRVDGHCNLAFVVTKCIGESCYLGPVGGSVLEWACPNEVVFVPMDECYGTMSVNVGIAVIEAPTVYIVVHHPSCRVVDVVPVERVWTHDLPIVIECPCVYVYYA